jgi:hypothetical protein
VRRPFLALPALFYRARATFPRVSVDCPPERRVQAALAWLMRGRAVARDGGLPAFYDLLRDAWAPGYPETTGYLIPTLLRCAERNAQASVRQTALELAEYLLRVQAAEGGIPGWGSNAPLYVFDTGQVLQGWLAALQITGAERFRRALIRAADWLLAQQEPGGYWQRYQFGGHVKTWDVRVAWPLIQVGLALERPDYVAAGRRCLDWALTNQRDDGWFDRCWLEPGEPPVLHTIAYAVEGFLESGFLLHEPRYVAAGRLAADALLARQRPDGSLSTYWAPGWRPLSRSSCLTGDAQMALCWLRLYQHTGESRYLAAGRQALAFVASTQILDDRWPPVQGAIAGSWPVWGRYLRWRYPNWAVKFFLDALLLECELTERANP